MINVVRLVRRAYMDFGTYGKLILPGGQVFVTVERPWLHNEPYVSCIPEGEYDCEPGWYNGGGYAVFAILDVPGRSHILFHVANTPLEVEGCIGVGKKFSRMATNGNKPIWAVTSSTRALKRFMSLMGHDSTFRLVVTQYVPNSGK